MAIELISKIKPKNNGDFPMVDAADVEMADGTRLEQAAADLASTLSMVASRVGSKQDTLVSGTNIKTVNGQSLLGSGDITIEGGGGGSITVDENIDPTSANPVQNRAVAEAMAAMQGAMEDAMDEAQGTLTALAKQTTPVVTAADNGKVLAVVNGVWTAVAIPSAEGDTF